LRRAGKRKLFFYTLHEDNINSLAAVVAAAVLALAAVVAKWHQHK
jgi:hypothetical protein